MRIDGPLPFHGYVVWLTPEQGGRDTGPPATPPDQDFAATGFVPPMNADTGVASLVLRVQDRVAWRSQADAAWLVVENVPPHRAAEGDVSVVTEGRREVAYFHVRAVDPCDDILVCREACGSSAAVSAGQTPDEGWSAWTGKSWRPAPVAFERPDPAAVECVSLRIGSRWRCLGFSVG